MTAGKVFKSTALPKLLADRSSEISTCHEYVTGFPFHGLLLMNQIRDRIVRVHWSGVKCPSGGLPRTPRTGCFLPANHTTTELGFSEDSIRVILFNSNTIEIRTSIGAAISEDPRAAAQQALRAKLL